MIVVATGSETVYDTQTALDPKSVCKSIKGIKYTYFASMCLSLNFKEETL